MDRNNLFGMFAQDDTKYTAQQREELRQERQRQRELRLKEEADRRAESLSEQERDREIRKILTQLDLKPEHREDLLQRRGLTDEQIKAGMFRSVEKWQKLEFPVSDHLAGVQIGGRYLTNSEAGYLCPAWNVGGLIIGWQLRCDNTNRGGKYRWASSQNRNRPNGPTSHLQNGELPLSVCLGDRKGNPGLIEGILKPKIASVLSGQTIIGAAGGNFQASWKQLIAALEKLGAAIVDFYPDAGAVSNPQAYHRDRATVERLMAAGYKVRIADWGQLFDKSQPDYDELLTQERTYKLAFMDESEFLQLGGRSNNQRGRSLISHQEWIERFGLPSEINHLGEEIKRRFSRVTWKFWRRTGELPEIPRENLKTKSSAIVLWQAQPAPGIWNYSPGNLPTPEEWTALGYPRIEFPAGMRLHAISEAYQKGYRRMLESSITGQGKSHDLGRLTFNWLGEDFDEETDEEEAKKKPRIFYLDVNHRNPSTETVERNFEDLISRHDGLIEDSTRRTALGYKHERRIRFGENPNIPGNCPETRTFQLLQEEKDTLAFGGKGSPICESCPLFDNCDYLKTRHRQLNQQTYLRAHPDQLPSPRAGDVAILEEPGRLLKPTKVLSVKSLDIKETAWKLLEKAPKLHSLFYPVIRQLDCLLNNSTSIGKFGLNHDETLKKFPTHLKKSLWETYQKDWLDPNVDPWGIPNLEEAINLLDRQFKEDLRDYIIGDHTPEEKQAFLKEQLALNWLSPLLHVLLGTKKGKKISLHLYRGELQITKTSHRHRGLIRDFSTTIFLDATLSKQDLTQLSGLHHTEILELRQAIAPEAFANLTIKVVRGMGHCGKQRRSESEYSQQRRINAAIAAIKALHPEALVGAIDFKGLGDYATSTSGHWFHDNRGTNAFSENQVLIAIGSPLENLGALAATWKILTGQGKSPAAITGEYGDWVRRRQTAELIQLGGRLRAQLRSNTPLSLYLVGEYLPGALMALQQAFPGSQMDFIEAYDLCPAAATKGEQTARAIVETFWARLKNGAQTTCTAIAQTIGRSQGHVSQCLKKFGGFTPLKKLLGSLLAALESGEPPGELTPDQIAIAQYLPEVVKDFVNGQMNSEEATAEILEVARALGRQKFIEAIGHLDKRDVAQLMKAIAQTLAIDWSDWMGQQKAAIG